MDEHNWLADQFEADRPYLRAVAYRMLGSLSEAEDAVQEGWLRLSRSDTSSVENLTGWLTTVVARVCLDMLRSRKSKHEESLEEHAEHTEQAPNTLPDRKDGNDPNRNPCSPTQSVLLYSSCSKRLLPPNGSPSYCTTCSTSPSTRSLPSSTALPPPQDSLPAARRRIQGAPTSSNADLTRQREVVDAFLAAARGGNLRLSSPSSTPTPYSAPIPPPCLRAHPGDPWRDGHSQPCHPRGRPRSPTRTRRWKRRRHRSPRGRLLMVLRFTIAHGKIVEIEAVADPDRLSHLDLAILND
jgi:hypothetical protein